MTPVIIGNSYGVCFNLDTWKKLPTDLQNLIRDTFKDFEPIELDIIAKSTAKDYDTGVKAGIQYYTPPADEQEKWKLTGGLPSWQWIANRMEPKDGETFIKTMKDWHGMK